MVVVTLNPVEPRAYQAGLMGPFGEDNILAPIVFQAPTPQYLREACQAPQKVADDWLKAVCIDGIERKSATTNKPFGVFARYHIDFRNANDNEMKVDVLDFGEQVVGPIVDEVPQEERAKYASNPVIDVWGAKSYFVGPPRIVRGIFSTISFSGEVPKTLEELASHVDEVTEKVSIDDATRIPQFYVLAHAQNGDLRFGITEEPSRIPTLSTKWPWELGRR